jgi:hypothetical protein
MNTPQATSEAAADLLAEAFRAGESANDHNRRIFRHRYGSDVPKENPYLDGTALHRRWREGYNYRDMVNDG